MLVLIGVTPEGSKQLVLPTGVRESAQSWRELLIDVKRRGLETAPDLAIGDGASRSSAAAIRASPVLIDAAAISSSFQRRRS
jgi:transposase-like protein